MTFDDLRNSQGLIGPLGGGKSGQKKLEKHFVFLLKQSVGRFFTLSHSPLKSPRVALFLTMATVQTINVTLPSLPSGWSADKDFKAVGTVSAATQRNLEPVGPHFLAHARRVRI